MDRSLQRREAGFSLVELLAVLLILGMIGTIATVSWQALLPNQQLNSAVRNLSEVIYGTRSEAISRNRPFEIHYDVERERYWVRTPYRPGGGFAESEEEEHLLTSETNLKLNGVSIVEVRIDDAIVSEGTAYVRFDPLGAASNHAILLRHDIFENFFTLEVLPLTGEIRFHEGDVRREPAEENDFQ